MSRPFYSLCVSCKYMLSLVHAALREIFDESAYARFLQRNRLATGPKAYSAFLHETETTRQRRPRCC